MEEYVNEEGHGPCAHLWTPTGSGQCLIHSLSIAAG